MGYIGGKGVAEANKARQTLTQNINRILEGRTLNSVAVEHDIPQRSLWNLQNPDHDPRLSTIERVATSLGLDTFELLRPDVDDGLAYNLAIALRTLSEERRQWLEDVVRVTIRNDKVSRSGKVTGLGKR